MGLVSERNDETLGKYFLVMETEMENLQPCYFLTSRESDDTAGELWCSESSALMATVKGQN